MPVNQYDVTDLLTSTRHLGLTLLAGPELGPPVQRVVLSPIDALDAPAGSLVIAITRDERAPSPYQVDVALRQAIAREFSALLFIGEVALAETARSLASRGPMRLLASSSANPTTLAMDIDRVVRGDVVGAVARAEFAIERATAAAQGAGEKAGDAVLAAAGDALGIALELRQESGVSWTDPAVVCVGETPVGRLGADDSTANDAALGLALPVIASILSRALQRELSARFAPAQSRSDLIGELILADSSRIDSFTADAARLGLPLQLSHAVGWLRIGHRSDPERRPPRPLYSNIELFALQLVEPRPETWHVAMLHDDIAVVSTEPLGAGDHQRRLREVGAQIMRHTRAAAGEEWVCSLGLGTPQLGASGLRQSAAEARITVETMLAAGRAGGIEATDVTGLSRVLLDFYASPLSRRLLDDVLAPLDELGADRSETAVRTLQSYLANRNSLARAAEQLNLHPNAVNYRIRKAEQTLGLDLADPDNRFAVELACRVRLLSLRQR